MSFETRGAIAPDHPTVSYPGSSLRFRAPAGDPTRAMSFAWAERRPSGVRRQTLTRTSWPTGSTAGHQHGRRGGGLDVVLNDPAIADARAAASAIVLQIQGAQTLSNRLYTVHPRRNDRFLRASGILRTIYRDVDFTEFHFTRHMLDHLRPCRPTGSTSSETNCAWPGWPG
jgi:hypothetical protein